MVFILRYAGYNLKNNRELTVASTREESTSLRDAADKFKKGKEMVLFTITQDTDRFSPTRYANESLKNDPDIIKAMTKEQV